MIRRITFPAVVLAALGIVGVAAIGAPERTRSVDVAHGARQALERVTDMLVWLKQTSLQEVLVYP